VLCFCPGEKKISHPRGQNMRSAISVLLSLLALCHGLQLARVPLSMGRAYSSSSFHMMAGFGGGPAKKKGNKKAATAKVAPLNMKKQWDRFKALAGSPAAEVFARARGDNSWTKVGQIRHEESVAGAAAVQLHKRLILEHAVRVEPKFVPKARELECGFATGDAEPKVLQKSEPAEPSAAGFEGEPDSSGRYFGLSAKAAVDHAFGQQARVQ
jgi:hypothetical protein